MAGGRSWSEQGEELISRRPAGRLLQTVNLAKGSHPGAEGALSTQKSIPRVP